MSKMMKDCGYSRWELAFYQQYFQDAIENRDSDMFPDSISFKEFVHIFMRDPQAHTYSPDS